MLIFGIKERKNFLNIISVEKSGQTGKIRKIKMIILYERDVASEN